MEQEELEWDDYIEAENDDEYIVSPEIRMLPLEEKRRVMALFEKIRKDLTDPRTVSALAP